MTKGWQGIYSTRYEQGLARYRQHIQTVFREGMHAYGKEGYGNGTLLCTTTFYGELHGVNCASSGVCNFTPPGRRYTKENNKERGAS